MAPLVNITITVEDGTTNHGDPRILCMPTEWTTVLTFFFGNYVAHAASVVMNPGQSGMLNIATMLFAFLYPTTGIARATHAILSGSRFSKDPLRRATKALALCMVIRGDDWLPHEGDSIEGAIWRGRIEPKERPESKKSNKKTQGESESGRSKYQGDRGILLKKIRKPTSPHDDPSRLRIYQPPWALTMSSLSYIEVTNLETLSENTTVHGFHKLPPEYSLALVPEQAKVVPQNGRLTQDFDQAALCEAGSLPKSALALVQLIYAVTTLIRSSGNQIRYFGWAAYGLTVIPYAIMSGANLIANVMRPDYPAMYLVRSGIMDEAARRGGIFEGVVGTLQTQPSDLEVTHATLSSGIFELHPMEPDTVQYKTDTPDLSPTLDITHDATPLEPEAPTLFVPSCSPFQLQHPPKITLDASKVIRGTNGVKFRIATDNITKPKSLTHFRHTTNNAFHSPIWLSGLARRVLFWTLAALPLVVYAAVSKFRKGESTMIQRVVTLLWLAAALGFPRSPAAMAAIVRQNRSGMSKMYFVLWTVGMVMWLLVVATIPVLGFWQVGSMMVEYGDCRTLY